uniref:Uncharacterized protein n=1 Tax=Leersia perrieri TaxID=77586 RepID=A0A0D9X7L0_9ORYZ
MAFLTFSHALRSASPPQPPPRPAARVDLQSCTSAITRRRPELSDFSPADCLRAPVRRYLPQTASAVPASQAQIWTSRFWWKTATAKEHGGGGEHV